MWIFLGWNHGSNSSTGLHSSTTFVKPFFPRVAVTSDSGFHKFHHESWRYMGPFLWVWPMIKRLNDGHVCDPRKPTRQKKWKNGPASIAQWSHTQMARLFWCQRAQWKKRQLLDAEVKEWMKYKAQVQKFSLTCFHFDIWMVILLWTNIYLIGFRQRSSITCCTSLRFVTTMGASWCMSSLLFRGFWEARISQPQNCHLHLPRIWGSHALLIRRGLEITFI